MRHIFRSRPVPTEETHRVTAFEVFFDLVFVFAFTRVISFMAQSPSPLVLGHGLVLLLLLWWPFTSYVWLANQVRADVGLVRAGMLVVMAAIFVAALVLPDAWRHGNQPVRAPLILALAYIVVRAMFLALSLHISGGNRRLRVQVLLLTIPTALGWLPLLLGVVLGGAAQTVLWAVAFLVIDVVGSRIIVAFGGFPLRSPSHGAERYGLVLIIALGVSLTSVGAGAGSAVTRWPVLTAALLGLTAAVCLWWLYFENAASPAGKALARLRDRGRATTAADAYALNHFLLIAGVIYLALGTEQVLGHVTHNQPRHPTGAPLGWTATAALYGGVVLYLTGRVLFLRLTVRHTPRAQVLAVGVVLVLLPIARNLPTLVALGVLSTVLVALVCYERITWEPTAAAR
ncbi:MAG: hypothetical protein V7603_6830 [Micromonosporaceae bacterium]